jgi:diguanylate cyclase (GGDEF)-like protein/PAS domain S-box-containing protein
VADDPVGLPADRLLDSLEVAIMVFDRDFKVVVANRRARDELGAIGESIRGDEPFRYSFQLVDEHGIEFPRAALPTVRTLQAGEVISDFLMGLRSDGQQGTFWVTVGTAPIFADDGSVSGVVCTFADVSEQRNTQEALRESEERFRLLAESAADVVYRVKVGPSPQFEYMNPAVESVLGYVANEFYEKPGLVVELTHDEDVERVLELGRNGVDAVQSVQLRMMRRDGTMIWTEHRVVPLRDAHGVVTAIAGIARDVTALKVKEAFLSHRALHDALTGLPNRVLLLDRLESALARLRRHQSFLAVLYLDLDRFKTVNDNLGHEIGDRLLHEVARRLQDTLRPSDSVARLGGDEFAAVLPDLHDATEAVQVAERLLAVVAEPVDLGEGELVVTVSIGIAGGGDGSTSAAELLRRADFAMYAAKDRGRARVESYDDLTPTDPPTHAGGDATAS